MDIALFLRETVATTWSLQSAFGFIPSNDLLSVPAQERRSPNPVFAQRRTAKRGAGDPF
jgi:hypothetical protein